MENNITEGMFNDTNLLHDQVTDLYEALADRSDLEAKRALEAIKLSINQIEKKYEI
jgi:hypothetical protein